MGQETTGGPMVEITEKQLKLNEKEYMDRVEKGEPILLKCKDGRKMLMVPQDPSLMQGICDI
tara:strand:- start:663 stop:848 length:186 start_codon:yes stop_codon:yes gene_type:complete